MDSQRFRSRLSTLKSGSRVHVLTGRHKGVLGTVVEWNAEKMKWKVQLDTGRKSHFMSSSLKSAAKSVQQDRDMPILGVSGGGDPPSRKMSRDVVASKGRSAIQNALAGGDGRKDRRKSLDISMLTVSRSSRKSDGTLLEVLSDNTLRATFKDGTRVIKTSDRKVTHRPDGTRVVLYTPPLPDGVQKVTKFKDGCVVKIFTDGREVQIEPDGTIVQTPSPKAPKVPTSSSSTRMTGTQKRPPSVRETLAKMANASAADAKSKSLRKRTSFREAFKAASSVVGPSATEIASRLSLQRRIESDKRENVADGTNVNRSKRVSKTKRPIAATVKASSISSTSRTESRSFAKPRPSSTVRNTSSRRIRNDNSWLKKRNSSSASSTSSSASRSVPGKTNLTNGKKTSNRPNAVSSSAAQDKKTKELQRAAKAAAKRKQEEAEQEERRRLVAERRARREAEEKRRAAEATRLRLEREARAKREAEVARRKKQHELEAAKAAARERREKEEERKKREWKAAAEAAAAEEAARRKRLKERREKEAKLAEKEIEIERRRAEKAKLRREEARRAIEVASKAESEARMKREAEKKREEEAKAQKVLERRKAARLKQEKSKQSPTCPPAARSPRVGKTGKAAKWPWCAFHFDGEVDCEEFVPDTYHRKFPARMCKNCGKRLGKHKISAVKKKEHVLKAVEAGPLASQCWTDKTAGGILFVGGYKSVASSFCRDEGIAHVLTVARGLGKRYASFSRAVRIAKKSKSITFLNMDWDDSHLQKLSEEDLFTACKFIHENVSRGQHVLVHCAAGQSRSATIAVAYLCALHGYTDKKALYYIKQRRTLVDPNKGFREKLGKMSKDGTLKAIGKRVKEAIASSS